VFEPLDQRVGPGGGGGGVPAGGGGTLLRIAGGGGGGGGGGAADGCELYDDGSDPRATGIW
jgi:hypothetical protein